MIHLKYSKLWIKFGLIFAGCYLLIAVAFSLGSLLGWTGRGESDVLGWLMILLAIPPALLMNLVGVDVVISTSMKILTIINVVLFFTVGSLVGIAIGKFKMKKVDYGNLSANKSSKCRMKLFPLCVVMFLFLLCGAGSPIKTATSGYVLDKDTRLPIEGAVVIRSWNKFVATPAGRSTSHNKHEEALTDALGRYSFPVTFVPSVGVPVLSGVEENNMIAYKAGYNYLEVEPGRTELLMEKTAESYYRRHEESEKAYGNYSVDYDKTKQLRTVVELEKLLIEKMPLYVTGLFSAGMSVDDINFDNQGNVVISSEGKLYSYERLANGAFGRQIGYCVISSDYPAYVEPDGTGNFIAVSKNAAVKIDMSKTDTQPDSEDMTRYRVAPLTSEYNTYSLFANNHPEVVAIPGKGFYALLTEKAELRGFDSTAKQICNYSLDRNLGSKVDIVRGIGDTIVAGVDSTHGTTLIYFDQNCKIIKTIELEPSGLRMRSLASSGDGSLFMATNEAVYAIRRDFSLVKIVGIPVASWGNVDVTRIKVDRSSENLFIIDRQYPRVFLYDLKHRRWYESEDGCQPIAMPRAVKTLQPVPARRIDMPAPAAGRWSGEPQRIDSYTAAERKFQEIVARNPDAVIKALSDSDGITRRAAAAILGQTGNRQALAPLIKTLHDPDISVKSTVIDSLGLLKDPLACDDLISELVNRGNHYGIRAHAAKALGNIGVRKAEKALIDCLEEPLKEEVYHILFRQFTIGALGQLKAKSATEQILDVLNATKDREIREEAITALGNIGDRRATRPLIRLLTREPELKLNIGKGIYALPDADKRIKIIIALGKIADPRALPALAALLDDDNPRIFKESVKALATIGSTDTIAPLCRALSDTIDEETRKIAVDAIIGFGQAAVLPLTELLDNRDPKIRAIAARVLGETGGVLSVKALIIALKDKNILVRCVAANSLGSLHDPSATDALKNAARDPGVATSAMAALAKIGAPAVEALVLSLQNASIETQVYGAALLAGMGEPAVSPLKKNLRHGDVVLRTLTMWIYAQIGKRSRQGIMSALQGEDEFVRARLVEIIGNIGAIDAVDTLMGLADKDASPLVRARAIEALGKIKDSKSRPVLATAAKHESTLVRNAAAWALRQF